MCHNKMRLFLCPRCHKFFTRIEGKETALRIDENEKEIVIGSYCRECEALITVALEAKQ